MAIQLTPEQEYRLQAVVKSGAYPSVDEALNAALTVVETATRPTFEGSEGELDELLTEGLSSEELTEEEFWRSIDRVTDGMLASHKSRNT